VRPTSPIRPLAALAAAGLLATAAGCIDTQLEAGVPELELSQGTLDFGAVERGSWRELSMAVFNVGSGTLHVSDYTAQPGSSDAFYFDDPAREIAPGAYAELLVRYTPTHEGSDAGAVIVTSDDEDEGEVPVFLLGSGVVPHGEVEPTLLYYPLDEGPQSQGVIVRSTGSGPLVIEAAEIEGGVTEFTAIFPPGYEPPVSLDPGLSLDVTVTYTPSGEQALQDRLLLTTSDPELDGGLLAVELVAAGEAPEGNTPPLVEIVSPADGAVVLEGTSLMVTGQVADLQEPPTALATLWHSSLDGYLGGEAPDAAGVVQLVTDGLSTGTHTLELRAFDGEGLQGSDAIEVLVYAEDDELEYVLSGGTTEYHYFHVDDDLEVRRDGTPVFVDADGTQDHHPPLSFFASPGDTIHLVATDQQYCTQALDGLWLHLSTVHSQALNDPHSLSACPDHDDYDPGFDGPWPDVFVDEQYAITIP